MYSPEKIEKNISKLERLVNRGRFDCNLHRDTAQLVSDVETEKTRDMYTKMLDLLVALSKCSGPGNEIAAEGIRLVYNAECGGNLKINVDRAFAILEEAALASKWSESIQGCIVKSLKLDDHTKMDYRSRRNRDRMHDLTSVYSLLIASEEDSDLKAKALVAVTAYVNDYPASKEFLPDDLYARIFPEEFRKAKKDEEHPENELNKGKGDQ